MAVLATLARCRVACVSLLIANVPAALEAEESTR
jgi:hypothetical protein